MHSESAAWIDPHIHFFALDEGQYHWLKPQNPPYWPDKAEISAPIYEQDLFAQSQDQLAGFIHIEAGFDNQRPWREIQFLERHCTQPFKAIACIDLLAPEAASHITLLSRMKSVTGLRHILDDDALTILKDPKAQWCLSHMASVGLSFEVQADIACVETVRALLHLIARCPSLKLAINHVAVAPSDTSSLSFSHWRKNVRELGLTGQVAFKFSGLEMQNRAWTWQHASTRFETLISEVDIDSIMFASNYPLSSWCMPYANLWQGYKRMSSALGKQAQQKLCLLNARAWYGL